MGIISWIILGLIVGVFAKLIMPGKDPGGFIITILIGIAGAFVGGYIVSERKLENFSKKLTWSRPKKRNRRKISPQKAFLIARAVFSIH